VSKQNCYSWVHCSFKFIYCWFSSENVL